MINAKDEFLYAVKNINRPLLAASIVYGNEWDENGLQKYELKCNYTVKDWHKFLDSINFKYDNGYGGALLGGSRIYFSDFIVLRGEYDGSEWWEIKNENSLIPSELGKLNDSWLLDKVLRESNLNYIKYLKPSTVCKLLKTKGYSIEEVSNWFQLLESEKEENYLLCLTIINSKIKL